MRDDNVEEMMYLNELNPTICVSYASWLDHLNAWGPQPCNAQFPGFLVWIQSLCITLACYHDHLEIPLKCVLLARNTTVPIKEVAMGGVALSNVT